MIAALRSRHVFVVLVALLCACWPAAALAEKRVALIVANGAYEGAPLSNPSVDLELVAPALEEMGFSVTSVRDADFDAFDAAILAFADAAEDADIALFYFAGHGFALNDGRSIQNYLMSTSADVTAETDRSLRRQGIALDEIIALLTSTAKTSLIFVDACRNDPRVRSVGGGTGRGLAPISIETEGDVFVGLSTRLGDVAADGVPGQGSPFARAFVAEMTQPGVNVPVAFNRVRMAVQTETRVQRPEANRSDLSDPEALVLVAKTEEAAPLPMGDREAQAGLAWELIKDTDNRAQVERFAALFADTSFAETAQARLRELGAGTVPKSKPGAETGATFLCDRTIVADASAGSAGGEPVMIATDAIAACEEELRRLPNTARFELQLGRAYRLLQREAEAVEWFRRAFEHGSPEAPNLIAAVYDTGSTDIRSAEDAYEWYKLAADRYGDASAFYNVGRFHFYGTVVPENLAEARRLFQKSAEGGYGPAMPLVAYMALSGAGGPVDALMARRWYEAAAALGDKDSTFSLGTIYRDGLLGAPDHVTANSYFEKAVELGSVDAMIALANAHFLGLGVDADYVQAMRYYLDAALKDSPSGLYGVGMMYRDGKGVAADPAKALDFFEAAAARNHGLAAHAVALLYETGNGVAQDSTAAAEGFIRALVLGEKFTRDEFRTNSAAYTDATRRRMQELLRDGGFFNGTIDGVFGPATQDALDRAFGSEKT